MVSFTGLNSVRDRTIFTNRGPISKKPLPILIGNNVRITSELDVEIPTGNFTPSNSGLFLDIVGSSSGRNDGRFIIDQVLSSTKLRLKGSNFNIVNSVATTDLLIGLVNNLKSVYNNHLDQMIQTGSVITGVHGTNDTNNTVSAPDATDLPSSITLVNSLRTEYELHRVDQSLDPPIHINADSENKIYSLPATDLNSAVILANEIKRNYENHRQEKFFHVTPDVINQTTVNFIRPVKGTFPDGLTGPFDWTLLDPQYGEASNDPYDVSVVINGDPVTVEAVIGQLGAIVLEEKPIHGDDVKISYSYIKDPPQRNLRLNSFEFNLNQSGNNAFSGLPGHSYASSSYLIDPLSPSPDYGSPLIPKRVGWKYKAIERAYSAVLNDPTSLLLNVPANKISFPVFEENESEVTITYDPVTLPQESGTPWTLNGEGEFSLNSAEKFLSITDNKIDTSQAIDPPFFSQSIDLKVPSYINAAFRLRLVEDSLGFDGDFTGVAFCIADGLHIIQVGLLQSKAINLSTAISLANSLKAAFNKHIVSEDVHDPDDLISLINVVDAFDTNSLIILSNSIKAAFNGHLAKGPVFVHQSIDTVDAVSITNATNTITAIALLNDIRERFNSHLTQTGVHFLDDILNNVALVKQIGIFTKLGVEELASSWITAAVDWSQFTSYRVFRDVNGEVSLFLSGSIDPIVNIASNNLPSISDLDIDLDSVQQVFFGSISRQATSISQWQFIRMTVSPVDSFFIESNKSVLYDATTIPQLDTSNPWINIGTAGTESIISGSTLLLDSNGGASSQEVEELGLSTGAFRGYLRIEPVQNNDTTTSVEFRLSSDYFTHSIDNQSLGLLMDDGSFSIQLSFLQFSPTTAQQTGSISEAFNLINGDNISIRLGDGSVKNISFLSTDTSANLVSSKINAQFGFSFASNVSGRIRLSTITVGSTAKFEIISGSAVSKLGLNVGQFFGVDSNPEPKVSWYGDDFPDKKNPAWIVGGSQTAEMFSNVLRVTDRSTSDFLIYSQENPNVTGQAISPDNNWKLNFRFRVLSFISGDVLPAFTPNLSLNFDGLTVSVDEGPTGKNLELHLASDGSDTYLNLVSYNSSTNNLDVIAQYAFDWNDGRVHSVNIFTNKGVNQILVIGDGTLLSPLVGPTPGYNTLLSGSSGPIIAFGSGSNEVNNINMQSAQSVIDWHNINIIRDSKINNPDSDDNRYVGLYVGGPVDESISYLLYQIDWTLPHTYRLIRDPVTAVSVYVDGGSVPVITTSYDTLSLPPSTSSYLYGATNGRSVIAFGSFSSIDISRSRWEFVNYSIGKLTQSELIVPPHNLLNQHNIIASGEHLRTNVPHTHHGFTAYSGGTPQDDFMSDNRSPASVMLNEGTPPIQLTQDLENRGGLIKTATLVGTVPIQDFVDFSGNIANFENDTVNTVGSFSVADLANTIKNKFNRHIVDTSYHLIPDNSNVIVTADASSISESVILLNAMKVAFNSHLVSAGVHTTNDSANTVTASDATDLNSAITLANDINSKYDAHISSSVFHSVFDSVNTTEVDNITSALQSVILLANDVRSKYLLHVVQTNVHLENDTKNDVVLDAATDLSTAIDLVNSIKRVYNSHLTAIIRETQRVHITNDTFNNVSISDATDIDSLTDLAIDLKTRYEAHRVQPNVHAATVFISIEAPQRVLYDNIRIWKTEEGDSVPLSPFCDSLIPTSDNSMLLANMSLFAYEGTELPENYILDQTIRLANGIKSVFNAHLVESGVHVTNDVSDSVSTPDATNLSTLLILLNAIKVAFNVHLIRPGVHTSNNPLNTSIAVDAISLGTAQALVNDLRYRYELHRRDSVLHLDADFVNNVTIDATTSPTNPGWRLFTDGIAPVVTPTGSSIKYGTVGLTETMYRYDHVMPRSEDVDFEFSIRMKINSFAPPTGTEYDSRIYAGFTSDMSPGVAAAIGFDFVGGIPSVKIHDLNADEPMARVMDDWRVAGFRTYKIIRSSVDDTFRLVIE